VTEQPFTLRQIAIPAFGPSLLFGLGEGAILPVIALSVRELGGSVALAALIVTLIGIGSLVCNIPASILTTRYGERWALVAAALWSALAMTICVLVKHLGAFAAGVFMVGMAGSVFGLARQSYLTESVPFHYRARALSTLGGVMRIGLFIGPFLGAAVIPFLGIGGAFWVGVASQLVAAALSFSIPDLPGEHRLRTVTAAPGGPLVRPTVRSVTESHMRIFITVGIGVVLVAAVRASRQAVVPLWAEQIGLSAATISLIYGMSSGLDMLVFYPAGRVMDRKGRLWVAVPSMLFMGLSMLLMPFTHGAFTLLLAALLMGFGNGIGSGMIMTLGADYSPAAGRAHFLGIWRLLSDIGSTAGPALLSAVTALLTLAAGIWCNGLIAFAAAGVLLYWIPRTHRAAPG
jgi:MFS family permease